MCGREANFSLSLHCFSAVPFWSSMTRGPFLGCVLTDLSTVLSTTPLWVAFDIVGEKVLKHVLGRALESQRTKGDCREAMKTKGKFRFSAAHSNLTMLQTNTNAAQAVRSITLAQQLKRSRVCGPLYPSNSAEHA